MRYGCDWRWTLLALLLAGSAHADPERAPPDFSLGIGTGVAWARCGEAATCDGTKFTGGARAFAWFLPNESFAFGLVAEHARRGFGDEGHFTFAGLGGGLSSGFASDTVLLLWIALGGVEGTGCGNFGGQLGLRVDQLVVGGTRLGISGSIARGFGSCALDDASGGAAPSTTFESAVLLTVDLSFEIGRSRPDAPPRHPAATD